MSNPIFNNHFDNNYNRINYNNQQNNSNQFIQNMIANNPKFQEIVSYINQNGGNAKTAFYNMAAQKGVNPNVILNRIKNYQF